MQEKDQKIIERVRQLLAMAADTSSPNEAAIAAGRARKLMDMHQITLDDLKDEDTGFGFRHVDKSYRFLPMWKDWLAVAIAQFNDCKCSKVHEWKKVNSSYSYRLLFQGFEVDVIIAASMYDYLTAAINRLCAAYIATLGYDKYPAKIGDAYKKEASSAICSRLRTMQKEREQEVHQSTGTSLVVFKMAQVEAEFGKAEYVTKKLVTRKDAAVWAAQRRGREDGGKISLATQIESGDLTPKSREVGHD